MKTEVDGQPALLIRYASGGVTPGDSYVWIPDESNRPRAWRLYVKVIPVKGLQSTWEGWITLPTGALISTEHKMLGGMATMVHIGNVAGASTLAELEPGNDPFAPLMDTAH
jgi:hypothetical protein